MISPLETAPDLCRWQTALLEHMTGLRNRLAEGGTVPDEATLRFYHKITTSVRQVEELKNSNDPMLVGPPPRNHRDRTTWLRMRSRHMKPIEHELDILLDMPKDGYVPELEDLEWPYRLVSCLMACERNFEERTRSGAEQGTNQELADETWPIIVAAAEALEALDRLAVPARVTLH